MLDNVVAWIIIAILMLLSAIVPVYFLIQWILEKAEERAMRRQ